MVRSLINRTYADAAMNAADLMVLEYLTARAGFAAHQVAHLRAWWGATATADETLADFLVRQGLVSAATAQIFRQVGGGHLTAAMGFALVDRAELEQVRRRLPEVAVLEDDQPIDATITLLAGADTVKDLPQAADGGDGMPRVGAMLGKYLLTEWVGSGAMGSVFRALHPALQIPVAIKVLNPAARGGPERLARLESEARLLAMLNHPSVVRVYDFEAHPAHPFLVLEHVNGPSLAELIEQSGRIQPDRVVRIIRQIAGGLAAAHKLGIVHRDVKPANVLLTRIGEVKLADLGLATLRSRPAGEGGPSPSEARVGTACYLAPELAGTNRPADERSDMYSLGVTFFHALTGNPPFDGRSSWQVIAQHLKTPAPCPRLQVADIPAELAELVQRMMAKAPEDRPERFEALLQEPALNCPAVEPVDETRPGAFWQRVLGKLRGREAQRQPG